MKREKKEKIPQPQKKTPIIKTGTKKVEPIKQTGKKSETAFNNTSKTAPSIFGRYTIFILIGLIFLIGFIAFKHFFNGDLLFFFTGIGSDSINQDYPAIMHKFFLQDEPGLSKYSFYTGMGNAYVLNMQIEPYGLIRTWIDQVFVKVGGHDYYVNSRFISIFIYNIFASGLIFFLYLRTINTKPFVSLIGALFMTFSGFMMTGAGWGFAGQIFGAVFLLFAFEQLFMKQRWFFFPFAVIYISGNLFNFYIYSLFLAVYFVFRYLYEYEKINKGFFKTLGQMILLGLIGVLMSAERIVTGFMKMYYSPRMAGNADVASQLSSDVMSDNRADFFSTFISRFFSSDLLGSDKMFAGWGNYFEAPAFYIGLLTLLIFPQVFIHLNKKNKILFGAFFLFWMLTAFIPPLRHLILANMGDYFRYGFSFFVPFVFLFFALFALNKSVETFKVNIPLLFITLGLLLITLYFPYQSVPQNAVDHGIRKAVTVFLILYGICMYMMSREKYQRLAQMAILLTVVIELSFLSYKSYESRDALAKREFMKDRAGYNDGTTEALEYIKSIDQTKFYRIEKDYQSGKAEHGSLNDAMAQGYYGTSAYFSFNQLNYVRFLEETELIPKGDETATRWIMGFRNYPLLQSFANVKYFLSKEENPVSLNYGYKILKKQGDISILKNTYALPFGYTYDAYIDYDDYKNLMMYQVSPQTLNNAYLECMARTGNQIESEQLMVKLQPLLQKEFTDKDQFLNELKLALGNEMYENHHLSVLKFAAVSFKNQLALLNGFVYEKESGLDVSGFRKIEPGDTSAILPPDKFSFQKYKEFTDHLKQDTFIVSNFMQHRIKGSINLKQSKMLFFTIPFDEAWKLNLNGNEERPVRVNLGFTGIKLPVGEHQIELYYAPPYSKETRIIAGITIVLFWSWLAFTLIRKRRKQNHKSDV